MNNLLQTAIKHFDQAEVYKAKVESVKLQFQNSILQNIDNSIQSAISLRGIKNNRLGYAFTRNLISEDELINNAGKSLLGDVKAEYQFPHSPFVEKLDSYDPEIEALDADGMAEECQRISNYVKRHTDAEIEIYASKVKSGIELINSNGTDLGHQVSIYSFYFTFVYPGSASGISYYLQDKKFIPVSNTLLDKMCYRYQAGKKVVEPESGYMQVLFMPLNLYALTWRLALGTSSKSFYNKTTPLMEKTNVRIFDEKLTFFTDPLDEKYPYCRPFDDEGVVCHRHTIINNGIFEKRFNDLNFAAKLGERPTGHGFRNSITSLPAPSLEYLHMNTGHTSLEDMIKGIKRGIILESILGAHSGNLPNGDFSIGVSPALYVEDGEIKGRLKEGMVSGNIYNVLKKVDAVEDTLHPTGSGKMPALLLDNVHVDI